MNLKFYYYVVLCALFCNIQNMHAYRRYVLSGGPGIGKTTVIKELSKRGYQTIPEIYTALFEQAAQNNAVDDFYANLDYLPYIQIKEQIRMESLLSPVLPAFLDRSAVDIIAYGDYFNAPISRELRTQADRNYDLIFLLEPLPDYLYEKTAVRKEDPQEALELHEIIRCAYIQRGYKDYQIIDVPFDTPERRAQFILDSILRAHFYVDLLDCCISNNSLFLMRSLVESRSLAVL